MIAIGAGGLDVAVCMAGPPFELPCPKIVGVFLENELQRPWIQAKDVILELLRRRGVRGGRGAIFEFTGPGVSTLSYTERGTIANMIAELARPARFSRRTTRRSSGSTSRAPRGLHGARDRRLEGDFDEVEHIDLAARPARREAVEPGQRRPGRRARRDAARAGLRRLLRQLVLRGHGGRGRRRCAGADLRAAVSATATPGSRQILDQITQSGTYVDLLSAGVRMLEPACGPCVGMGQAPPSGANSLRTFNRNFPGRSGTADDNVYLCSPAVAAASMLTGEIPSRAS